MLRAIPYTGPEAAFIHRAVIPAGTIADVPAQGSVIVPVAAPVEVGDWAVGAQTVSFQGAWAVVPLVGPALVFAPGVLLVGVFNPYAAPSGPNLSDFDVEVLVCRPGNMRR